MPKSDIGRFQPLGKWIAVKNDMGSQKKTESGIIYTEKHTGQYVKSEIVLLGPDVDKTIKVGDTVYWDARKFGQNGSVVDGNHIIHEDWIGVVVDEW